MRTAPIDAGPVKLKGLKISFLSAVTAPAHEGARALILKRRARKAGHEDEDDEDENGFSLARRVKRKKELAASRRRRKKNPCAEKLYAVAQEWATWLGKEFADSDHDDLGEFFASYKAGPVTTLKFDDARDPVVMTSSIDGHAHLLHLSGRAGSSTWQKSEGEENGHDHPFMITADETGTFTVEIGDAEGHTHAVDGAALNAAFAAAALSKLHQEDDMPKPTTPTKKTDVEIQATEDQLALARLFMGLNDAERGHFSTLEDVDKAAFAKLDPRGRAHAIEKAAEGDPVVYKDSAGAEYRKSDDPRLVAAVKRADEQAVETKKATDELAQTRLEKTASEELASLPGKPSEKAALWKALQTIPEDVREAAIKAVKAGDKAIEKGFASLGTAVNDELDIEREDADGQLQQLAQAYAEANKVSPATAEVEVLKTEKGRALYAKAKAETRPLQ